MSTTKRKKSGGRASSGSSGGSSSGHSHSGQTVTFSADVHVPTTTTATAAVRQTRLEEKAQLTELNDRLERYIYARRQADIEKEQAERALHEAQDLAAREKELLTAQYEGKLADLRAAREKQSEEIRQLAEELARCVLSARVCVCCVCNSVLLFHSVSSQFTFCVVQQNV